MSGTADEAKGRVKEAAGALTNDGDLKNEGKADQAAGKVEERGRDGEGQGRGRDRQDHGQDPQVLTGALFGGSTDPPNRGSHLGG